MNDKLPLDLEQRLDALERPGNQGAGFGSADWVWLLLLGVVGPGLLLLWGWQ